MAPEEKKKHDIAVDVRGLVNRFGRQLVHDGLDMQVYRGEVFGIVGGSGSGKSVLLRTILGLRRPQAGNVLVAGTDMTQLSGNELRAAKARYGVTFQHGALFTALTVLENIQLPMLEHLRLPADALDELARLKLRLVGLPADAAGKYPSQLSGGMIKRAALARALALDPDIVFLDEPTAGLDPIGAAEFDTLIENLRDTLGLTVFMVTHDLDSLVEATDRIAVLGNRKVLVDGTFEDLKKVDHPWVQAYFNGARASRLRLGKV
jgi:phospholipid/cholesterol/gamma-HCH transport system ATP-binding protein